MTLWLARLVLAKELLESRDCGCPVYSKFTDDYRIHQTSWEFFPGRADEARDFLTRLQGTGEGRCFYILSREEPVRPSWCAERFFAVRQVPESFLAFRKYRFSLLANPTKKVHAFTSENVRKKQGTRQAIFRENDLKEWFRRKGEANGFRACEGSLLIGKPENRFFRKKGCSGKHTVVEFTGVLEVTDRELFARAFENGIGTSKGFGYGMLLLAPVMN